MPSHRHPPASSIAYQLGQGVLRDVAGGRGEVLAYPREAARQFDRAAAAAAHWALDPPPALARAFAALDADAARIPAFAAEYAPLGSGRPLARFRPAGGGGSAGPAS